MSSLMFQTHQMQTLDGTDITFCITDSIHKEWLIVTHGLGEHALRHRYLGELFANRYNICLYDLRGHGQSGGMRGDVKEFSNYVNDLHELILHLQKNYALKTYTLFGHSMGTLITATYVKYKAVPELYPSKVFLSAPVVSGNGLGKLIAPLPQSIHNFLANLPLYVRVKGMLDLTKLSHDPKIYKEYTANQNNTLAISLHLFLQTLSQAKDTFSSPLNLTCKLYVAIPTADVLVDANASIEYFTNVEKNVELLIVKDAYHELHNEIAIYKEQFLEFLKTIL